jgi:uncharacterized protein YeaO (DUF488 family)
MLTTKSVHSQKSFSDGLRILAARLRGRGLLATAYDVWMPNLGPSELLLNDFRAKKITWAEFSRRYARQIRENPPLDRENRVIKNHGQKFTLRLLRHLAEKQTVTLMCHCGEDEKHCHRHLLKRLIEKA